MNVRALPEKLHSKKKSVCGSALKLNERHYIKILMYLSLNEEKI